MCNLYIDCLSVAAFVGVDNHVQIAGAVPR